MTQRYAFTREFVFRAVGPDELPLALGVRREVYIGEMGYGHSCILADPLDDRAQHFLATTRDGNAIASMRIVPWSSRPFEFEQFVDAAPLIAADSLPGEISRLCVLPAFRDLKRSQFVHAGMWKLAYDYALESGISDFWIWAPPEITRIYEYLGFSQISGLVFDHPVFQNRRYQVMHLQLSNLETDYRRRHHPFSDLLFGDPDERQGRTPQRR